MSFTKKFSIVIFNHERIHDVNNVIVKYSDSSVQSSSHVLFNVEPITITDITEDLTFFKMSGDDENTFNKKFIEMIDELDQIDTDYSIRDDETGEITTTIESIGALDIKFDNIKIVPKGTYKRIDELKNIKTEFGYCKGYKPPFRPVESKAIENLKVQTETIYLFAKSPEKEMELNDYLSEKIIGINSDFVLEFRRFK